MLRVCALHVTNPQGVFEAILVVSTLDNQTTAAMVVSGAFTQPLAASRAPQPDISAIPGRLGAPVRLLCRQCLAGARLRRSAANGARCRAFFKFKNPLQGDSESAGDMAQCAAPIFTAAERACVMFVGTPPADQRLN